jgi:hypothetical protein
MFSDRERWPPHHGLNEAMPQVFLFRSELRQTCHPTTWRYYAAGHYIRDGGYRHGSATSQAVSRIWDMHGFQSDVHVDGSIGRITLDEGCNYGFQFPITLHHMRWKAGRPSGSIPRAYIRYRNGCTMRSTTLSRTPSIHGSKKPMVVARDEGASRFATVCATLVHEQHHKAATSNSS